MYHSCMPPLPGGPRPQQAPSRVAMLSGPNCATQGSDSYEQVDKMSLVIMAVAAMLAQANVLANLCKGTQTCWSCGWPQCLLRPVWDPLLKLNG